VQRLTVTTRKSVVDMHDVGESVSPRGLVEPVLDVDRFTTYTDTLSSDERLKTIGATTSLRGVAGLMGRRAIGTGQAATKHTARGRLPAL